MFIQTEATPNPATLKFLPGRVVMEAGHRRFPRRRRKQAPLSPLAAKLFGIPGVTGVFYGYDFINRQQGRSGMAASQARHPRHHHGAFHVRRSRSCPRPVSDAL